MKYRGITVKKKPKIWEFIPWFSSYTAQAIYPYIFVSSKVYEDLQKSYSNPRYIAALEHEKKQTFSFSRRTFSH